MSNKSKKTKGKWTTKKKVLLVVIIAAIVVGILAGGYAYAMHYINSKLNEIERVDITEAEDNFSEVEEVEPETTYTTIAFFGIDNRSNGNFESGNSDSIMLVAINDVTKEVKISSVYRDTYLCVDDSEMKFRKANYAYNAGGPTQAITMLQKNLDVQISDYVAVDFNALAEIVELMGGLEFDVTQAEANEMNKFIGETASQTGNQSSSVYAGVQTLDGAQTVAYARIRKIAGNDYGRAERQREVVEKMVAKMKESDYATLIKILDSIVDDISTSFTNDELKDYAMNIGGYKIGETTGFPFEKTTDTPNMTVGSIVIPVNLDNNVEELHKFLYPDDENEYTPSETVKNYSNTIVNNLGQYTATE